MTTDRYQIVADAIRERETSKVLADDPLPVIDTRIVAEELMECAAWAPFHHESDAMHRKEMTSIVPWRFYAIDAAGCRTLHGKLAGQNSGKIGPMLAAADFLIQATWLPDNPGASEGESFDGTLRNMEHIAAASAAVQNLLVAATARGLRTYWSSGGVLRKPFAFQWLGIPAREMLLGSIFFFPADARGTTVEHGKHRGERGELPDYARWVHLTP